MRMVFWFPISFVCWSFCYFRFFLRIKDTTAERKTREGEWPKNSLQNNIMKIKKDKDKIDKASRHTQTQTPIFKQTLSHFQSVSLFVLFWFASKKKKKEEIDCWKRGEMNWDHEVMFAFLNNIVCLTFYSHSVVSCHCFGLNTTQLLFVFSFCRWYHVGFKRRKKKQIEEQEKRKWQNTYPDNALFHCFHFTKPPQTFILLYWTVEQESDGTVIFILRWRRGVEYFFLSLFDKNPNSISSWADHRKDDSNNKMMVKKKTVLK
jgi:hypothetical protein